MKFDSNQAWKRAAAQVSTNRDVLAALAGVFFLLPSLAFALFMPQPAPPPGTPTADMLVTARNYYLTALPLVLPMLLLQALATLAMLTLFTDRDRPTVAQALRLAVLAILPYIAAQLLLCLGLGAFGGLFGGLAALTGSVPVVVIVVAAVVVLAAYVFVKTSLTAPVIAVERVRNPIVALRRSWRLTSGNSVRIALFYLLIGIAFLIVISIVMALVGIVLALALGPAIAEPVSAIVSSALGALMSVYFVAILAAVHRQLAGPPLEQQRATFQ